MWTKTVSREEFLGIFQYEPGTNGQSVSQSRSERWLPASNDRISLWWRGDPGLDQSLPVVVIVERKRMRDFLAWVSTYLPAFKPFTAHCRVLDTDAERDLRYSVEPSLVLANEPSLGRFEDACIGLILGEASTYMEGNLDPKELYPSTCARTYSFSMARALSLRIVSPSDDPITVPWFSVRTITKQPSLALDRKTLSDPWSVLLSLTSANAPVVTSALPNAQAQVAEACLDLIMTGDIQPSLWNAMTDDIPDLAETKSEMLGPREARVVSLQRALTVLEKAKTRVDAAPFICGYLASQVGPGAFDHYSLLTPHLRSFPNALLWYGLCAGLQKRSTLQTYLGGLGRRVLREVLRNENVFDRPRCDIAFPELEMLSQAQGQTLDLRTERRGQLEVEIAPCVTTIVKWPRIDNTGAPLLVKREYEAGRLMNDLGNALGLAESLYDRLSRVIIPYSRSQSKKGKKR